MGGRLSEKFSLHCPLSSLSMKRRALKAGSLRLCLSSFFFLQSSEPLRLMSSDPLSCLRGSRVSPDSGVFFRGDLQWQRDDMAPGVIQPVAPAGVGLLQGQGPIADLQPGAGKDGPPDLDAEPTEVDGVHG